jgi:Asp-tRNA(Asn)/Glu-tRNA(Gln) amidotransferase A subunit family amidase
VRDAARASISSVRKAAACLPAALQIVGARYAEDVVLRASRAYESVHPFRMPA